MVTTVTIIQAMVSVLCIALFRIRLQHSVFAMSAGLTKAWYQRATCFFITFANILRLFNFFWLVEKHDANPANTGTIRLVKSVESVLICG